MISANSIYLVYPSLSRSLTKLFSQEETQEGDLANKEDSCDTVHLEKIPQDAFLKMVIRYTETSYEDFAGAYLSKNDEAVCGNGI